MDTPFTFRPGGLYIETNESTAADRIEALKQALTLVGDRTTEEILQAAHWIAEGDIIPLEGDNDEDDE